MSESEAKPIDAASPLNPTTVKSMDSPSERRAADREEANDSLGPDACRRSTRSSSDASSSSSTYSLASTVTNPETNDPDASSVEYPSVDLDTFQRMFQNSRFRRSSRSLSSSDEALEPAVPVAVCEVCLEESPIRPLRCCGSTVCSSCIYSHLSTRISEAQIRIPCPSCTHILTREEILSFLTEKDHSGEVAERYKRFYADINREPHIKTCPQCCAIKEIDKSLCRKKDMPRRVTCDECQFEWCFYCHAPWHNKMSCKEYRTGEKLLRAWAAQTDNNQQNAQQCPRCKVFISRNGGCPHMICSKCHCDFCYNCGKRRFGLKFLGSHDSRYSPFGCKYNLYPDKPILRYTVRGLVAGAATLAAPVAAVGAVALLAVGTTIGAPTYGTYRLVKHLRKKKRARQPRIQLETASGEDNSNDNGDGDLNAAIAESLRTYKEETDRREQQAKADVDDSDNDSYDEF